MLLEVLTNAVLEGAEHLLQAPGYFVLRFVLRRPTDRVSYDSAASALVGLVVWFLVAIGTLLVWQGR
jgi:hypothetical protein